jgi:hypothetical protein
MLLTSKGHVTYLVPTWYAYLVPTWYAYLVPTGHAYIVSTWHAFFVTYVTLTSKECRTDIQACPSVWSPLLVLVWPG